MCKAIEYFKHHQNVFNIIFLERKKKEISFEQRTIRKMKFNFFFQKQIHQKNDVWFLKRIYLRRRRTYDAYARFIRIDLLRRVISYTRFFHPFRVPVQFVLDDGDALLQYHQGQLATLFFSSLFFPPSLPSGVRHCSSCQS